MSAFRELFVEVDVPTRPLSIDAMAETDDKSSRLAMWMWRLEGDVCAPWSRIGWLGYKVRRIEGLQLVVLTVDLDCGHQHKVYMDEAWEVRWRKEEVVTRIYDFLRRTSRMQSCYCVGRPS